MMKNLIFTFCLFIQASLVLTHANQASCDLNHFKDLYIKLQQSLNYEGKDAVFNKKTGALSLVDHPNADDPDSYGGKVYEKVLHKQYTAALRKVALLYRHVEGAPEARKPEEVEVVNFFKSIDDPSKYPINDYKKFSQLVSQLQTSSKKAFSDKPNSQINDQDVYLLQKLLIHAYDTICRTQNYVLNKKQTADNRKAAAISIEKALGMMTESFRDNIKNIDANHEIVEVNLEAREATINNAVKDNLNELRTWLRGQNTACQKQIKGMTGFNNIQPCNYQKFIDSVLADDDNFKNYEAILHFINANQKHGKVNPKAETGLSSEFKAQLIGLKTEKACAKDEEKDASGNCKKKEKPPVVTPPIDTNNNEGKQCKLKEDEKKGYIFANWIWKKSTTTIIGGNSNNGGNFGNGGRNGNNGSNGNNGTDGTNGNGRNGVDGLNGNGNSGANGNNGNSYNGNNGSNGGGGDSSNDGLSCSCSGSNCCASGFELKDNSCRPVKTENPFDINSCNEKDHDLEKSKAEGKCIPKTPFDINSCNEKDHDLEKSKAEGKCISKTPFDINSCNEKDHDLEKSKAEEKCIPKTPFDINSCNEKDHDLEKSKAEGKCIDKASNAPEASANNAKCDPLPAGAIENLWKKVDNKCVCSSEGDNCCDASENYRYDSKTKACVKRALEGERKPEAEPEEEERDPIFSREVKTAPANFQPIILRDESIMIMPGQR